MTLYTIKMQVSVIHRTEVNIYAEDLPEAKRKVRQLFGFPIVSGKEVVKK